MLLTLVEARDVAKHPTMFKTAPYNRKKKNHPTEIPRSRNPNEHSDFPQHFQFSFLTS